jgi:NAD(P)-dependent dehydrogenase (short-subunit alcohol dehydrogenase family)
VPRFVLITGCSSGIGYHAAQRLQQEGFSVIASARHPDDVARLQAEGLTALQLDLTDSASIHAAVAQTLQLCNGRLYALFNNGAYGQPGALEDLPTAALRIQFETNFFGWHELTRLLLPGMLAANEGRIIQNSSVLGLVAMKYRGAYNASKFAIEGYTDTLRLELRGTGVQVSLIEPGPIASQFRANALAALRQHIDLQHSRHAPVYQQTLSRLEQVVPGNRFTLLPEACMPPLLHALNAKRARPRYQVTTPSKWMNLLRGWLPTRLLDALVAKSA